MRIILTLFFLSLFGVVYAQLILSKSDSLKRKLESSGNYLEKMELLGQLSDVYSFADSATALQYAQQMMILAKENKDERGTGIAYYRIGGAYLEANNLERASESYTKAETILANDTSYEAQSILARTLANHGIVFQRQGDLHTQLDYLLNKTIPINVHLKDTIRMGRNYHAVGTVFQNIREHKKAAEYFQKSKETLQGFEDVPEFKDNLVKISECILFLDLGPDYRDSVFLLLEKTKALLQRYPDIISELMYLQTRGMALEYFDHALNSADSSYAQASDLAKKNNIIQMVTALNLRRFYVKEKQEKYSEALPLVEQNYYEFKNYLTPRDKLLLVKLMMNTREKIGDVKTSLELHKYYNVLYDSLHVQEIGLKVHEMEQKYAAKEKENQIIKLNQLSQQQRLQLEKNRQWVFLLVIALLFLGGFFVALQNINRKKNQIASQQAELLEQRIGAMRKEQHLSYFAAMLEGQEQERKRLAIDLHDGLGGSLSAIRLKLSRLIKPVENETNEGKGLDEVAIDLDNSINDLRHIARNMMPESLLKYGLIVAIRDFCQSMASENLQITFQSFDVSEKDISKTVQIMVFRIFQELISNAVKHAKATSILAQCLQQDSMLFLTVEDDGVGFVTNEHFEGIGLTTLKNRVNYLGGKIDIQSEQNIGTTINIEFGLHEESQNRNYYRG